MAGDHPFFSTVLGTHPSKQGVIKAIHTVATMTGQPTAKDNQAITGHSLRVGGAQFLAAIGVALILIKLLARWDSNAVEGYVKDAPLASVTKLTRHALSNNMAGETGVAGGKLDTTAVKEFSKQWEHKMKRVEQELRHVRAISTSSLGGHEDLTADVLHPAKQSQKVRAEDCTAIINEDNEKVHICAGACTGVFRTRCGWAYASAATFKAPAAPHADGNRCTRCWRRVTLRGDVFSSASEST